MSVDYQKEIMIDRRSSKPLDEQVRNQLERLLSSARVINDERLLSAKMLAHQLNIDVKHVEKAYSKLHKDHFIRFDDNHIPYVSKYSRILGFFDKLVFIEEGIESLGKKPSIELLDFNIIELHDSDLIDLTKFNDHRFIKQVRMFKADNKPYIYLEEYYSIEHFPKLLEIDESYAGNIYQGFLAKHYDTIFSYNERLVNVHVFDQEFADKMEIEKGLTGFKIDMVYYDQHMKPFGYSRTYSLPHFYFEYGIKIR